MPELLTIAQVAERLQVSEKTVRRAIRTRGLRAFQVAGRDTWRVRPEDLEEWLEQRSNRAHPEPRDVTPVAISAARGRGGRRGTGVLAVEPGMGREAS
jgi:excisionase family DNA binding protein